MVVEAAFRLVREQGISRLCVKDVAESLGCSVQPVYSYCGSMDGLRRELELRAGSFIRDYLAARIDKSDLFRSTGLAYSQLAAEEPHIFQLFVLRRRDGITSFSELYEREADPLVARFIADGMGTTPERARLLHLNMLVYSVGIGTILATVRPGIPAEEVCARMDDAFRAFSADISGNG